MEGMAFDLGLKMWAGRGHERETHQFHASTVARTKF